MMYYFWGMIFFVFTLNTCLHAGILSVVGPCQEAPLFSNSFQVKSQEIKSIGRVSLEVFEQFQVPYLGTEQGINSIFDTPIGIDAMEVISSSEYLAYGWCYKVNEIEPSEFPHEIQAKNNDVILWWFGYARYKDGQWIEQCTPSYLRRSAKFCPKKTIQD